MLHFGEQARMTDEMLWEAGMERPCARTRRGTCRFEPCCVAQGIRCCSECRTRCHAPCPASGR